MFLVMGLFQNHFLLTVLLLIIKFAYKKGEKQMERFRHPLLHILLVSVLALMIKTEFVFSCADLLVLSLSLSATWH